MADSSSFKVSVSDPDQTEIELWLMEKNIPVKSFELIDVSDVTIYYDVVLTVEFLNAEDAMLFKLTWADK